MLTLQIEENKITAIVGVSGSGKTTLLKMLLGFYQPVSGKIFIGETELSNSQSETVARKGRSSDAGRIFISRYNCREHRTRI